MKRYAITAGSLEHKVDGADNDKNKKVRKYKPEKTLKEPMECAVESHGLIVAIPNAIATKIFSMSDRISTGSAILSPS